MRSSFLKFIVMTLAVGTLSIEVGQSNSVAQDVTITVKKSELIKPSAINSDRTAMDVAILLDTSGSMQGLISQAKSQLWNIVQEFAKAEKSGDTPYFRVSVFEYGNDRLPASEGYVRQVCGLTDDLDVVSEALFSLSTDGGNEFCGTVIQDALKQLDWSRRSDSYKAIFIAGNEPFDQGSESYKEACASAVAAGVVVNTIHCGDYNQGIREFWQDGAVTGGGKYLHIDQNRKVIHIESPQDVIIIELNSQLNNTYLWFGEVGLRGGYSKNQFAQDSNAGSNSISRTVTKAGKLYSNSGRDLVDTYKSNKNVLTEVEEHCLPDKMQKMAKKDRLSYLKTMANKRATIQKKIGEQNLARIRYVNAEKARLAKANGGQDSTLGDVMREAVRTQLIASGFKVN
ncbi:MAG: VWA domain-containing protein [Mariniblastus sp.]|nr:VWA domain-containing protein [Mariniblastus sp.]